MTKCPDCGCEAPAHYGSCVHVPPAMQAILADQRREADERRAQDEQRRGVQSDRARKFDAMKRATMPNANQTTIYGIDLATMNADEIRIAAYWLASQLEKKS